MQKVKVEAFKVLGFIKSNFKSKSEKINRYFENVTNTDNQSAVINIIRNFEYKEPDESIYSDVIKFITQRYNEASDLKDLTERMLFWVNDKIYDQDKEKLKKYQMSQSSFLNYVYPNKKLLLALEEEINEEDFEKTQNNNFIKQLDLIEQLKVLKS